MPDIVTGAIAGWFANRIFGPSVDALGATLSVHLKTRLPLIFGRAAVIAKEAQIEPGPIQPGLLTRMIMDASFSDDAEEITDWWANLFVSAALKGDNRHAVFSDMMAMIGPVEASCLKDLISPFQQKKSTLGLLLSSRDVGNVDVAREAWILDRLGDPPFYRGKIDEMAQSFERGEADWPIRLRAWKLYVQQGWNLTAVEMQSSAWFETNELALEVLARTGVLRMARVDVPVMGQPSWVDTVELTRLGAEFYLACTGATQEWSTV